jgi:tetratricopeptide (TPR) repeat protein
LSNWFVVFALCAAVQDLAGQPALSNREITIARTCLGTAEVQSVPVEASREVVVAVAGDTLSADDLKQVQQEVTVFFQTLKNKTSFRLAAVSGDTVQFAGPFKTRAQLQASFGDLAHPTPENAEAPKPLLLYSNLGKVAPQLGSDWTIVILAGRFPPVDPELAPFTSAWLATSLRAARLQVEYWTPGDASEILEAALPATGGKRLAEGLAPVAPTLTQPALHWEVSWRGPAPPAAFRVCPVTLTGNDGQPDLTIPAIAAAAGAATPDIEHFAVLREKIKSLAAAVRQPHLSPAQAAQGEADLNTALEVSPREEETLRLGAALFRSSQNDSKLVSMLSALAELAPAEPALFTEMGHSLFRMGEWDGADRALLKARALKPGDASVAEELARIRLMRRDDEGAIQFLEERLALGPGTQDLWLLRADTATRLGDWERNANSTEHAIALGPIPLDRRTALVRSYLEHQAPDKALVQVRAVAGHLPPVTAVRTEYARFLEDLKQPPEALTAWKGTLEVDPKLELAHYRITRLLMEKNAPAEALDAAELGIEAAPHSARLYLAKAEVLEKLDRFYDARETLRHAVLGVPDPPLLTRLAEMEDAGGEHAARYYRALAETSALGGGPAPERTATLQRGLEAALRDGDLDNVAWFQTQLGVAPAAAAARVRTGAVTVPGGLEALSFIAHSRPSSPERFLVEYARTVVRNLSVNDKKAAELYTEAIREHFRRVGELAALGTAGDGSVTVNLEARDKNGQKSTERVLNLLGWKMRASRQGVQLDPAEKGARAAHQETATALAVDEIGMQKALEAGKRFSFKVPMDVASVVLGEEPWKAQFYPKEHFAGGLAEAISGNLQLAQTYAALGQMDPGTATALVSGLGLRALAERYAALLAQFASALAVDRGRAAVPGGEPAAAIWAKLAGANPAQPGPFFKALLSRDDGKLLAYYAALSQLDIRHQRLFTRTPSRTAKFYELFQDAPETQRSVSRHINSGSFVQFLSEVPLDNDGNVDFPGSPEVWMVAKGQSHSIEHTAKMIRKLKRVAAPDVEDEILLRLARTRYKESSERHSELDNFLAVVRIDEHRNDPLDEASALLLAQHYAEDGAAYPYFAILTGLGQKQFEQFFAMADTWRPLSETERAAQLAPFDSLVEIVCLAQQVTAIDEAQSAALFGKIVERFQKVASPALRTAASLDLVREIMSCGGKNAPVDPDSAMSRMLFGSAEPGADLPTAQTRIGRYRQVLELQKVPSLATVLALADAARNLGSGKGTPAAQIQVLETRATGLLVVDVPKDLGVKGKQRDLVEAFQPRRLQEIVKQFHDKTAKKNVKLQDLERLSGEYLGAIDVPVRWALAGIIYAYFLRPDDLLVSEDPLLLRKHEFSKLDQAAKTLHVFEPSYFNPSSEKAGSYFIGGFAEFADAAGSAAAMSAKLGGDYGQMVAGKQIGALRSTNWENLRDEDLRLLGLKVAVAREWIVRASQQPELEASLAEATFGLLSLTRRAELLGALADGNWRSVWNVLTLSDLYFLAGRYLERYPADPWMTPATQGLRREAGRNDGARLQLLGAELSASFGCVHPHLHGAMPYEEYENDLIPSRLAERSAEFKLYLARYADTVGLSASSLGPVAETAARAILKGMQLSDLHDWRSVLAAFSGIDGKLMQEAVTAR